MADELRPREFVSSLEWIESEFRLPAEGSDKPGPYDSYYTPYFKGVLAALDDPAVKEVVVMKAAQVGWTFLLCAWIMRQIDTNPNAMVMMFPKEAAAREFNDEKFTPAVKSTPAIRKLINVEKSRTADNRALFKKFAGGFLKFVTAGSIASVKSTPATIALVEEPDDSPDNLKEQGSAIVLLWERTKRRSGGKRILGGTPSTDGFSKVQEHIKTSDRRVLPIACHECGDASALDWENVTWSEIDEGQPEHEVYGRAIIETAVYSCPSCSAAWDDYQRKQNIRATIDAAETAGDPNYGWQATADFNGVAGFEELNELYSCLDGAGVTDLLQDYLKAEHKSRQGDESDKIVFFNSKLGRPYAYQGDNVSAEALRDRALDYDELVIPPGGLLLTAGIDVQHDRVAVIIRAWGRGQESFGVLWTELYAAKGTAYIDDPVWADLEGVVYQQVPHGSGGSLKVEAVSIDSSDGNTNDAVYDWVRRMTKNHPQVLTMAIKGSSSQKDVEIFSTPKSKSVDHRDPRKQTKADRRGLKVYQVGTNRAKDLLAVQMKRIGLGPGAHHIYQTVRDDYFDQVTGEVKAPHNSIRNKLVWQKKSGCAVEAWDCEVYALHASRAKRAHLLGASEWDAREQRLLQQDMFAVQAKPAVPDRQAKPSEQAQPEQSQKVQVRQSTTQVSSTSFADLARRMNGG